MNRRFLLLLLSCFLLHIPCSSQQASHVSVTKQRSFPKSIPAGNYSGITWLGDSRYAVVDDKSPTAGFSLMTIHIDSITGKIRHAQIDTFLTSGQKNRDEEGICFVSRTRTLFISGEADNAVLEYRLDGTLTGRQLEVPGIFHTARANGGFEALTYNAATQRFWTTSEFSLPDDGPLPTIQNKVANRLRLQSFDDQLQPAEQYWYATDNSVTTKQKGQSVLGVSALAALDDGRLLVLEREVYTAPKKIGSFVQVKVYEVHPHQYPTGTLLPKRLVASFRTRINLAARSFANYEGMCVGPRLADDRQVIVLIADSQNQYRGFLHDWLRTIILAP